MSVPFTCTAFPVGNSSTVTCLMPAAAERPAPCTYCPHASHQARARYRSSVPCKQQSCSQSTYLKAATASTALVGAHQRSLGSAPTKQYEFTMGQIRQDVVHSPYMGMCCVQRRDSQLRHKYHLARCHMQVHCLHHMQCSPINLHDSWGCCRW